MARRNVTVLKDTWWMHTHARASPLSLEKIHLPHYELQTKCCNAANFYNMLSQGMPAWKSRNRALGWRETLNNARHTSQHAELDGGMKEHLNRTACGFFNSNCSTPSRQQHCSTWPHYVLLSFSTSLDEPSRKTFSSPKNARVWQLHCKEASSGRQPAEQHGREEECSRGMCMSAPTGIYWGITCITQVKTEPISFLSAEGTECSTAAAYGKAFKPFIAIAPDLLVRTPVTAAGYCQWLLLLLTSLKAATGKQNCISLNDL